jgi:hypothetical protein
VQPLPVSLALCDAKQERKEPKERIEVRTLIHLVFNFPKGKLIERKAVSVYIPIKTVIYNYMDERGVGYGGMTQSTKDPLPLC